MRERFCSFLLDAYVLFSLSFLCFCEWVGRLSSCNYSLQKSALWLQITLNQENKLMLGFAPDYDHLPLIAKVEVFEYALHNTEGNDLAKVSIATKCMLFFQFFLSSFLNMLSQGC